jgi:nucleotide-binding universal stress UspA family protein
MAGPFLPQHVFEQDLEQAHRYLDRVAQRSELTGIVLEKHVDLGDPAATILSHAEQQGVDLIVISSHGYTGLRRWLLGSVAEKVARHAPVPVFILRDQEPLRTHIRFDGMCAVRALVPLDTSARSQDAVPLAAALVAALSSPEHGQIQLAQIVVELAEADTAEKNAMVCQARQNLDAVSHSIRDGLVANVGPDLHLLLSWAVSSDSDIAEGIVRMAESGEQFAGTAGGRRCDLIAMTTHGANGVQRWATGSITERVLHTTKLPLLIVRPADMIEKERRQRERRAVAAV